jgi:hypothetical protein
MQNASAGKSTGKGANDGSLSMLGEHLVYEAKGGFIDPPGKGSAKVGEELLEPLVADEVQAFAVVWKQGIQFALAARVDDQVNVYLTRAQQAEVVIGQDGLAAETDRGVLRCKDDA